MFDHVTIRVSDRDRSVSFYDRLLQVLGNSLTGSDEDFVEWGEFSLAGAKSDDEVTLNAHIGFGAGSPGMVDQFWELGTKSGYVNDGEPGLRPQYLDDYYGAFLLDPDGNSIEAVYHGGVRQEGPVDHVWLRVQDLDSSRQFYEMVSEFGGFRKVDASIDRIEFEGSAGSFSIVRGEPTKNLHVAFPAKENEIVDDFHERALAAGFRDNGAPGERAIYHPGYYGAFVLDPDGNNVEIVNHNRRSPRPKAPT